MNDQKKLADIGLIGLATMGQNLALNIADKDYEIIVYNRTLEKTESLLSQNHPKLQGSRSLEEFVKQLKRPRKIILMIKAGDPVDDMLSLLIPLLEKDDIVIDGGNSHFLDTKRRKTLLNERGLLYIGMGISGGEEGARKGPSLMPGGDISAWKQLSSLFEKISAKTESGEPCVAWIGDEGSGHFVKMVHNGIEYGMMQLIAETYDLLKRALRYDAQQISGIFDSWNKTLLGSYLLEISHKILLKKDERGLPLLEQILDVAKQKGTGKWTSISALDLGIPLGIITHSVDMRVLTSREKLREKLSQKYPHSVSSKKGVNNNQLLKDLEKGLLLGIVICFAQGFDLIAQARDEFGWNLVSSDKICNIWKEGCIIRSKLLDLLQDVFAKDHNLPHLLSDETIHALVEQRMLSLRHVIKEAITAEIPFGGFSNVLSYFDSFRAKTLPMNLIQAQRDYFGAHGFEKVDQPRGKNYHVDWSVSF